MSNVAIVILNYLNYKDTIECIDSVLAMQYPICGIVVVDNGSENQSYKILKSRYKNQNKIKVISSGANLGYAKGNNVGITYARKYLNSDYILVANNDTVFTDKYYIEGLLNNYCKGVGVISGKIILKDGSEQKQIVSYRGLKATICNYINMLSLLRGSCFDLTINRNKPIVVLHGCSLMLTPDFFKEYKGFYKKTFLYGEEVILYYMCKCKNLRQVYVPEVQILHKEDMSSLMSFNNDRSTFNKLYFQSEKYAIWWEFKYFIYRLIGWCQKNSEENYERRKVDND